MESLEENYERFEKLNTVPLGISVDAVPTKKAWAEDMKLENLRLLSDFWPHGKVAEKFGVFREEDGFSERVNILLDKNQEVEFSKIYEMTTVPDVEEIIEIIKG